MSGLVYLGKIVEYGAILGADNIVSVSVVCGAGGRWRGVVRKSDFALGHPCIVFLPDSLLNPNDHGYLPFMAKSNWRVKMQRFKGAPSEVLIIPCDGNLSELPIGTDLTEFFKVTRYVKPVAPNLQGLALGAFPDFIPKTDEPCYQGAPELVQELIGKPWFMTEKCDGSSTTAFRWKGRFGVCSRNLELVDSPTNGYWQVARKYKLDERLPEGMALQWETCGPGVQGNPMSLAELCGFAFSAYDIAAQKYLPFVEFVRFCGRLGFPQVTILGYGDCFDDSIVARSQGGVYLNGKPREGVVIRSQENIGHKPISFKVINLEYDN